MHENTKPHKQNHVKTTEINTIQQATTNKVHKTNADQISAQKKAKELKKTKQKKGRNQRGYDISNGHVCAPQYRQ